jgi:hypothetical protein
LLKRKNMPCKITIVYSAMQMSKNPWHIFFLNVHLPFNVGLSSTFRLTTG